MASLWRRNFSAWRCFWSRWRYLWRRRSSLNYQAVSTSDPLIFGFAIAFLGVIAALASYLPGLRAMSVDPVVALRNE
jgi:ABC-type antimicrobial peptide transport system permease subunit